MPKCIWKRQFETVKLGFALFIYFHLVLYMSQNTIWKCVFSPNWLHIESLRYIKRICILHLHLTLFVLDLHPLPSLASPSLVLSYRALRCLVLCSLALNSLSLPCLVLSCFVLSCLLLREDLAHLTNTQSYPPSTTHGQGPSS